MGVDGRIFPVGTKPLDQASMFSDDWLRSRSSRPDIGAFQGVMLREGENGRQRGFFIAFGYSRDAEQECRHFISERVESSSC